MSLRDFIFTVIGGLVVWVFQQFYQNRRERIKDRESKLVKPLNTDRVLPQDIFNHLGPRNAVTLMREMLGSPNRHRRSDSPVFSENEIETNSYLYFFRNGYLKVTSKDNETIDSVTVRPTDNSIWVPALSVFSSESDDEDVPGRVGEVKLPNGVEESPARHTFIQTRVDASFAIQYYTGYPIYLDHTYFGFAIDKREEYFEKKDAAVFVGEVVDSICVSSDPDSSFYIYDMETL